MKTMFIALTLISLAMTARASEFRHTNKLISEKSPYLLAHAHNPVDWYPWGQEAFARAQKEDKPIFLSVGYSTCHWCHVMEEESYSNPRVAQVINEGFIAIKVDREERPDIDSTYMRALEAMSGSGGWPLNMFLTPDLKPFYGGTYFPPDVLIRTLKNIVRQWRGDRAALVRATAALEEKRQESSQQSLAEGTSLGQGALDKAFAQLRGAFDGKHGGFGFRPKFPQAHVVAFLLRYFQRGRDPRALRMAEKTLDAMAQGGMHDQIGGGFHRYSTDEAWFIPHFEKMLYDQAMLSRVYLQAYQLTGKETYARVARRTLDYVLREMTSSEGGFYTAQDADSLEAQTRHRSEGAYYLWTQQEMMAALGKTLGETAAYYFGVTPGGNTGPGSSREFWGKNILHAAHDLGDTAGHFGITLPQARARMEEARSILLSVRRQRPLPPTDDKILTDLNGLMIASLSYGAGVLHERRYLDAAQKAADFLLKTMNAPQGRLLHRYRDKEAAIGGFLDDYAFFSDGLFELYEAGFNPRCLAASKRIAGEMGTLFADQTRGGFYFTAQQGPGLRVRIKEFNDSALPSGNSMAALVLLKLGRLTMDPSLETQARRALAAFASGIAEYPAGHAQMLAVLDYILGPSQEIVIAGDPNHPDTREMIREMNRPFLPNKVVCLHPPSEREAQEIEALVPFIKTQKMIAAKATVYLCANYACRFPSNDPRKVREDLTDIAGAGAREVPGKNQGIP